MVQINLVFKVWESDVECNLWRKEKVHVFIHSYIPFIPNTWQVHWVGEEDTKVSIIRELCLW